MTDIEQQLWAQIYAAEYAAARHNINPKYRAEWQCRDEANKEAPIAAGRAVELLRKAVAVAWLTEDAPKVEVYVLCPACASNDIRSRGTRYGCMNCHKVWEAVPEDLING